MFRRIILGLVSSGCIGAALGSAVAADVTVTAQINKTRALVGEPLQLTLTLEGDGLQQARLQPLQLPPEWSAVAESQSQEVTWQGGQSHRRLVVTYIVVARAPGDVQLGPFTVERGTDRVRTAPLAVHVEVAPAPAPPSLEHPPGGRITL